MQSFLVQRENEGWGEEDEEKEKEVAVVAGMLHGCGGGSGLGFEWGREVGG